MTKLLLAVGFPLLLAWGTHHSSSSRNSAEPERARRLAEWTILVFMNGDNNLEQDALVDFAEMASAKSSPQVNVVLQFDRHKGGDTRYGNWQQTLRFVMKPGLIPTVANAVQDLGEQNMGDPAVLSQFVDWGRQTFPAKRVALVVWDHGQGYRFSVEEKQRQFAAWKALQIKIKTGIQRATPLDTVLLPHEDGVFRSVSDDEQPKDRLYMKELQDALAGRGLALIGFDACLMAMVEVAYALESTAEVLVGSEDLEPGTGWNYENWLSEFVDSVTAGFGAPPVLGRILVRSYSDNYGPGSPTTLSAVELTHSRRLGAAVSALADTLRLNLPSLLQAVVAARGDCREYAPPIATYQSYHIDLVCFADALTRRTTHTGVHSAATHVRSTMTPMIVGNWAGVPRRVGFGSHGLAIYFPANRTLYDSDPFERGGYRRNNTIYPVEFVTRETWADFLHAYLDKVP